MQASTQGVQCAEHNNECCHVYVNSCYVDVLGPNVQSCTITKSSLQSLRVFCRGVEQNGHKQEGCNCSSRSSKGAAAAAVFVGAPPPHLDAGR